MNAQQMHIAAKMLLESSRFCEKYRTAVTNGNAAGSTAGTRRTLIRNAAYQVACVSTDVNTHEAETMRRYIDQKLGMPKPVGNNNTFASMSCPDLCGLDQIDPLPSTPSTTQEPIMNKTSFPLTVEKKTFLNGTDISTLNDAQIFDLIAAEEERIEQLEKIKTKPKRLVADIERRREGLRSLIEHLDSEG